MFTAVSHSTANMSSRRKQILMPKLPSDVTVKKYEGRKQIKLQKKVTLSNDKQPAKSQKSNVKLPRKEINKNNTVKKQAACIKVDEQKDFYPNRLKRKLNDKKIVLKPKNNMKVVVSINKRKSAIPQKGKSSDDMTDESDIPDMELSMYEAVRISEETRNLSDEDLLEILTCPSPVWWEDPPSAGFVENAICRLPNEEAKNGIIKFGNKPIESKTIDQLSRIEIETPPNNGIDFKHLNKFKITSNNFNQKKKKLEGILCNLQQKTKHISRRPSENIEGEDLLSDISMNEEEILKDLENISIPIEGSVDKIASVNTNLIKMDMKDSNSNEVISDNNDEINKSVQYSSNTHNMESMKLLSRKCVLKEISRPGSKIDRVVIAHKQENFNNDKYTNIGNGTLKSYKPKLGECLRKGRNLRSVIKRPKRLIEFTTTDQNTKIPNNDSIGISRRKSESKLDINLNKSNIIKVRKNLIKKEFQMQIPDKLPPLKRRPFIPLKDDCKSSDSSEMADIDSISDTNIEFITDDDSSNNDNFSTDTNNLDNSSIDQNYVKRNIDNELSKKLNNDITEYITVYKIVSNDEVEGDEVLNKLDKKKRNVRKLNNFFKKCKKNKRSKKDNPITDDCKLKCNKRFIIDYKNNSDATDEQNRLKGCDYCIVQFNKGETNFSCETCNMAVYTCGSCNYRTSTKESINNHMSRCKKVHEIPWRHPYVLKQT